MGQKETVVTVISKISERPVNLDAALVVRLEADPDTLRERILAREPPGWGGLPDLLNASRRLAESMKDLGGVDLVISTEGRQPAKVAEEL